MPASDPNTTDTSATTAAAFTETSIAARMLSLSSAFENHSVLQPFHGTSRLFSLNEYRTTKAIGR